MDPDSGSSVTLIYYRIGEKWWKEPFLNVVAAAAQMSSLTHVEIALGEEVGTNGMMTNVCRVFNDKVGVELVERTGRSPHYVYQSLGCSKAAVNRMLRYAKTQCVGKPFSNTGMARSLLWPRQTDGTSFFCAGTRPSALAASATIACVLIATFVCAELVAAILREGGLLEASSNPGSATPETLHKLYLSRAAATANPYVLRDLNATTGLSFCNTMGQCHQRAGATMSSSPEEREALLQHHSIMAPVPPPQRAPTSASALGERRRSDSPPRGHFRVISSVPTGRGGGCGAAGSMPSSSFLPSGGGSSGQTGAAVRAAQQQQQQQQAARVSGATTGQRTGLQLTLNSLDMRSHPGCMALAG
jgi:uncharacterized membrane protein YgcG